MRVMQCYYSDEALTYALIRAIRDRQVTVGFIADGGQCKNPWMREPLGALLEWGADVRLFSPPGGAAALMHAKAWLIDDCLAITGSCNGTVNSMGSCFEMMVSTRSLLVTTELRKAFDAVWAVGVQLDLATLPEPRTPRRSRSSSVSRASDRAPERREDGSVGFLQMLPESPRPQMSMLTSRGGGSSGRALPEPRMQDDGNARGSRARPDSSMAYSIGTRRSRSTDEMGASG